MPRNIFRPSLCALVAGVFATLAALSTTPVRAESFTVTAPDGVKLAVQETGNPNGPVIIFIHGLLGSNLNWEAQLKSAEFQRYRLITYDLRGHGIVGHAKRSSADEYRRICGPDQGQSTDSIDLRRAR